MAYNEAIQTIRKAIAGIEEKARQLQAVKKTKQKELQGINQTLLSYRDERQILLDAINKLNQ